MRPPVRTCQSVDIELPLRPCPGTAPAAPAARRRRLFARQAVAGAVIAAIAGCATHDTNPAQPFRVEPVLRVSNAVQSSEASQAYCTLGRYFDGLHEWSRAADAWRQAVAADNRSVEALDGLGVALAQGRHFAEAEAALRQAVALAPERARIRNNLGYVLLLQGRPQEAMAELELAVSQEGGYAIAQANLREAMLRTGVRTETAVATATAAAPPVPAAAEAAPPAREVPVAAAPAIAAAGVQAQRIDATAPAPAPAPAPAIASASASTAATVVATTPAAETDDSPAPAPAQAPAAALAMPSPATDETTLDVLQGSRLEVSNGNGINGMAARVGSWLAAHGLPTARLTNQQPYAQRQTVIQFRAGHEAAAHLLASLLPASAQTAPQASPELRSDIRVVLGRDWSQVAQCLARSSCQPAAPGTTTTVAAVVAQR